MTSCDESKLFHEKNTVLPLGPGKIPTRDTTDFENSFEPEAKRRKSVTPDDRCSPPQAQPARPQKTTAPAQATAPAPPQEDWQCGFCTYINNALLPYCEVCGNPHGSAGEYTGPRQGCFQVACGFRDHGCFVGQCDSALPSAFKLEEQLHM